VLISLSTEVDRDREPYEAIAQMGAGGASPRGSTYWRRAQLCPREHLLGNVLGWDPLVRADALDTGLLWHGVLETYYRAVHAQQLGERRPDTPEQEAFRFLQKFRDHAGWIEFYEICSRMLDAYVNRWERLDADTWEIVAVEFTCGWTKETHPEVHERLGFEQTTRLDLVVVDHSLAPVTRIVEHKSSYALDPQTIIAYSMDDQIFGQLYLGRYWIDWAALGYPPFVGTLVNVTTKAKTPRLERLPVQPADEALHAWAESKRYWAWQAEQYSALGYPRNYAQCSRRFGRCQFYELCRRDPAMTAQSALELAARAEVPGGYEQRPSFHDLLEVL